MGNIKSCFLLLFELLLDPSADSTERIKRLFADMDAWKTMNTLEIIDYIMVILGFADFRDAKEDN